MSSAEDSSATAGTSERAARWGLAAKLFAVLILLGAVGVLVTGALGYVRAREALEDTIYKQLTAARETKAKQVETYFHTISAELRVLAQVLAPRNPINPVATFYFVPGRSEPLVSTRIRLAGPQDVLAIAEMNDGTVLMTRTFVEVATNGCE